MPAPYSVDAAIAWVDAAARSLDREHLPLRAAPGRVLTESIHASGPIPLSDRATRDGFAVQASASFGASAYNPVRLPLITVGAGEALPAGTDAVVPLELAEFDGQACIEAVEAVAAGDNVEQKARSRRSGRCWFLPERGLRRAI